MSICRPVIIAVVAVVIAANVAVFLGTHTFMPRHAYSVYMPQDIVCDTSGYPHRGNPKAPVLLVVYEDFECRFHERMHSLLDTLLDERPQDILVYYKMRPLFEDPFRRLRARAACAVHEQGKYFEMSHALGRLHMSRDDNKKEEKLRQDMQRVVDSLGLDNAAFETAMNSERITNRLEQTIAETKRYGITRVPAMLVNGMYVRGAVSSVRANAMIDKALRTRNTVE